MGNDQPLDNKIESEDIDNPTSINYPEKYRQWEKIAEGWYRNLTTGGVRYTDKNDNIKGITNGNMAHVGGAYVRNQRGLAEAQREMKKIREEAARHGIIIPQSRMETATAGF